ncbi:MAG: YitT family protein [Oscillospiraceae bacterium]|nr:YitT family protein [Oscillospiraceae bacterium]
MKKLLRQVKPLNLLALLGAGIVNAVGVTMFLAPVNLYDSGISGTSMLLWQVTPDWLLLPLFLLVLNLPIFLFGAKKQGAAFTVYSVWAVAVYAGASFLIIRVLPVNVVGSSPVAGTDLFLCAAFGGLISGAGSGLTLRFGGAIDGIEVLASIYARRLGITVGTFVMIYNVVLYVVIGCVFGSWTLPLYSIITYCVAIRVVDFIVEGLDKAKSVIIITTRPDAVCHALSDRFGKGITRWDARGYYSGSEKCAVYFVVNRFQIPQVKNILRDIDPLAFVTVNEVSDVLGTGQKMRL